MYRPALRVPAALGENPCGEDGRVARAVDRNARYGHAGRHLRDRQQRVETAADALRRAQRDADHRQVAVGGHDARKRGRHPGAGDDHAHSTELCGRGVLGDPAWVAMGGEDLSSCEMPRSFSSASAGSIASRSDSEPTRMPTGAGLVELLEQPDRRRLVLGHSSGDVHRLRRDVAPVARSGNEIRSQAS